MMWYERKLPLLDRVRAVLGLGIRCPDCKARPGKPHHTGCSTGAWDGGVWA